MVDRIEAIDALFGRWLPASTLALLGPLLVLIVVLLADRVSGAILAGAGLLVPLASPLHPVKKQPGLGTAVTVTTVPVG